MKRPLLVTLVIALSGGCAGALPPDEASPPTTPPTAAQTVAPTTGATSPPSSPGPSTAAPSPAATVDWPPVPEDDVEELPPIARLLLPDGTVGAGRLGSFTYRDSAGDSPWLGAGLEQLEAALDEQLTIALRPGFTFDAWRASYAAADDPTGEVILPLDAGSADALGRAIFDAPPVGEWVIQVGLTFSDGEGDAVYYWHVLVR